MKKLSTSILLSAALLAGAHASITSVDLELSLAVDVSSSINAAEFDLMIEGYALAFESAAVQASIVGGPAGAIAVNMIQFATSAAEVVPWTIIDSTAASDSFAGAIRAAGRSGSVGGSTGIGEGLAVSSASFVDNGLDSPRQVIDVSGDGTNNTGREPAPERDAALAGEVDTINGIVIGDSSGSILAHYESEVIGGDKAFATSADDFADFAEDFLAKLNAEIAGTGPPKSVPDFPLAVSRSATQLMVNSMFEDINGRLFRARAGFREPTAAAVAGSWSAPAPKGGMSKEVLPPPPGRKPWEVFGSVGLYYNDVDSLGGRNVAGAPALIVPSYEMSVLHGTVGIEYDFAEHYSIGAALLGATGDIEVDAPNSDMDLTSLGVAAYGTYFREDAFSDIGLPLPGDFWADLLYAFQNTEYDLDSGPGSADADVHRVEFNTGLNFKTNQITHGPVAGLVYADGDIDPSGGGPTAQLDSLATRLGYQASYRMPTAMGDVIPQVRATWEHEFEDDPVIAAGVNLGAPDSDTAILGGGVLWHFHDNFYAILDYQARLGDTAESHNVVLRVGGFF